MQRKDVKTEETWDLSEYYKSAEEWAKDFEKLKAFQGSVAGFSGKMNKENEILQCLTKITEISQLKEKLFVWAYLKQSENVKNFKAIEMINSLEQVSNALSVEGSFIDVEIGKNSSSFLNKLAEEEKFYPYSRYIKEIIRNKPHILSGAEEKLLSSLAVAEDIPDDIFSQLVDGDLKYSDIKDGKGKVYKVFNSNMQAFLSSHDRVLRKNAFQSQTEAFKNFNNTLSAAYISSVKLDCTTAKIRRFSSSIEAVLFSEQIDEKIYRKLIGSVRSRLSVFHKYYSLKAKSLGLKDFGVWDLNSSARKMKASSDTIKITDAKEIIKKAVSPLGEEYVNLIDKAFKERWIDYCENEGKQSGAFSWGAYNVKPVVLMTYKNKLADMFTLAHELGHANHSYLSDKSLPFTLAQYKIFCAEIASEVNEVLLIKHLLKGAKSKDEKIMLFDRFMLEFDSVISRQTMFSEFEEFSHSCYENNQPLSGEVLNEKFAELRRIYYGKRVKDLKEAKSLWGRISHFYNAFYVYKYATGFISALAIVSQIEEEGEEARKRYIKFLSGGGSKPPLELLKDMGIDLNSDETYEKAFRFAEKILKDWEKELR